MGGDDEGRTILVSGVPTDFRLEAIRSYFENKRRSNGGPIKGIPERIQDSGKVIITFESEKDAENVVQRKVHNINKFDLRVNWYKDLVWQEDAMIVSNGHKDMSEKMLIDLLEEKGKLDIVYVSPGRKPGTFLVYCQNEIDFEYVQKLCQKNPLKGNPLKVDTIEEINSVQVKTVSSNVSSESLESYFGNRKKSSGGDISSIRQETNGTYIVSFKEACVVLDVCRRRHQLEGVKLNVQPFWEPSEENTISKQQVFEYLLPSKFHLTFLKRHRIEVNDQLKKLAEVLWGDSKIDKLKFKNIEGNFEEIEQSLKDLLNSITVEIVDIPIDIFDDIVGTFNSEADQKYIYFDIRYCKAHILAFDKNNMIKMKNRLLDNLRIEHEDDLDIHERRILSGLRFFEQAERRFEELKVTVHSNKVIFEGHYSKAADCQKDMYKILRSIVKSELRLPFNTGMIINKEPVKEYLDEKLRDNNCIGSWEPGDGDSVLLYASDKTHLSDLEEVIKQSFVANTLDFVDKIKGTPNHGKWLTFVESLKTEFPDFCFIGEDSIVAVDEVINDIKSKIDNFEQSLTYESYISMNHAHFLFLKEFNEQEINDYGEKNKMKNVCLKDDKLHVEGTQEQIRKMETFIENLRKDISSKEKRFEMFGFQEFLESEEGKNFLCKMQKKSESIISLNSDLGSETDAANDRLEHIGRIAAAIGRKGTKSSNASLPGSQQEPSSVAPRTNVTSGEYGGIKINLMSDSITNASVDVIINSSNEELQLDKGSISKFILKAAGSEMQVECNQKYPRGISTSEIAITKGYNLNCKNVFHLVLPPLDKNSSGSVLKNLTQIITTCLETAERLGAKSLAFPILGAGVLKYPIENLPRTMYEAVRNYSDRNPSQIKVVNFVVYPQDTEILKKFKEYFQRNRTIGSAASLGTTSCPLQPQQKAASMAPQTNVTLTKDSGIKIDLMIDSISNASVDVIVNSSNEELQLDKGSISKVILNAAGPRIQDECKQEYPRGISTSEIAVTKGYNLNCKNVFHLTLPPWDKNSSDSILANLTQMITICLKTAERMGAKSLAFPILGAGTLKYPIEILPRTMYEAVKNYSDQNSSQIKDIYFVVYPQDTEILKKFNEYFQGNTTGGLAASSDDEFEEIEDNVSDGQQDDDVTLKFIANYKNLDHAIETVKEEYLSQLTTEELLLTVDLEGFRKLSLRNIGTRHKVQISIRDTITIHGRHCHVKDAKLSIQSLLMEFKETDEEIIFKDLAQWSYFEENSPGNLITFNDKENAKLENAYSLGNRFLNYNKIKYDIKKMRFQLRQMKYKMKRKILKDEPIPDTWSPMGDKELMKIVPVTNGPEYDDIQATFRRNLPSSQIIKIERIQNKTLYLGYQALKKKFETENPNIRNEVHGLWHGTAAGSVDGINKSGFNRSYCGKNATAFGEGVYFARDIDYSARDTYSVPDTKKTKRIYKCSVLVGKVMQGKEGLKVLQDSCNSTVNDIQNPAIYVIFHDNQAYPHYLITFSN